MIHKIFRVLSIDLYASHLVNAICKHDWITSSFSVYVIRMFFTCVCLVDMISGQTMGSLELYALFFFQLRLLLESTIWLWAIWRIPRLSLLILTELTFYLWSHTKAPICKARVCRWIWQKLLSLIVEELIVHMSVTTMTIIYSCQNLWCWNVQSVTSSFILWGLPKFLKTDSLPSFFSPGTR